MKRKIENYLMWKHGGKICYQADGRFFFGGDLEEVLGVLSHCEEESKPGSHQDNCYMAIKETESEQKKINSFLLGRGVKPATTQEGEK